MLQAYFAHGFPFPFLSSLILQSSFSKIVASDSDVVDHMKLKWNQGCLVITCRLVALCRLKVICNWRLIRYSLLSWPRCLILGWCLVAWFFGSLSHFWSMYALMDETQKRTIESKYLPQMDEMRKWHFLYVEEFLRRRS